jgi:hypothetical protein
MSLCESLHGRQPWPELELPREPIGSSPERGRRRGVGGATGWVGGGGAMGVAALGRAASHLLPTHAWLSAAACCVQEEGRRREEKEEDKEKMKKIIHMEISGKNNR